MLYDNLEQTAQWFDRIKSSKHVHCIVMQISKMIILKLMVQELSNFHKNINSKIWNYYVMNIKI